MFLLFTALLVAADQVTKIWAVNNFDLGSQGEYIGLGFFFTYVQNTGAAFGIFQGLSIPIGGFTLNGTRLLGILSLTVSIIIAVYLWRSRKEMSALQQTALTLILAGALGNMIDRFRLSYVIDFIHFNTSWLNFPVFNIADSCVVIGAGLLIISSFFSGPEKGTKKASSVPHEALKHLDNIEPPSPLSQES